MFDAPTKAVTDALRTIDKDAAYRDVLIPRNKRGNVKLVTALRHSDEAILGRHSVGLEKRLNYTDPASNDPAAFLKDVVKLNHFCYRYDEPIWTITDSVRAKTIDEQLRIEFPHWVRGKIGEPVPPAILEILRRFFSVVG